MDVKLINKRLENGEGVVHNGGACAYTLTRACLYRETWGWMLHESQTLTAVLLAGGFLHLTIERGMATKRARASDQAK